MLSQILITILLPLIPSVILPFRWVWRTWVFIAMAISTLMLLESRQPSSYDGGAGAVVGLAVIELFSILLSCIIFIRFIPYLKNSRNSHKSKATDIVDFILSIAAAIVLSLFVIKSLSFILAGLEGGLLIHLGLGIATLLGIIAIVFIKKLRFKNLNFLAFFCITLVMISSASFGGIFYPYLVIKDASTKVGGAPYCISLSNKRKPPRSNEDLMFLTMDKTTGNKYHAVLLIDNNAQMDIYHWSYTKFKFDKGTSASDKNFAYPIYCHPAQNFLENLESNYHDLGGYGIFYLQDGSRWKISNEYSPHISESYISIYAKAPDFKPIKSRGYSITSKEATSRNFMEKIFRDYRDYKSAGKIGDLSVGPSIGSDYRDLYYHLDEDGKLSTIVDCYKRGRLPEDACQHRFYKNDAMYSFDHSVELLEKSTEMEQDLFNLFESFKW